MKGKFLFIVLLLAGVTGGCYYIFLEQDMDYLRAKAITTRQKITHLENQIGQIRQSMTNKSTAAGLIKNVESLKEEISSLEEQIKKEEADYQPLVEAHRAAIAQIRQATVGRSYDELSLSNGTTLKAAMIQQVGEDEIVIKHSLGIRRSPSKEWPAELKARLMPGALADTQPTTESAAAPPMIPAPAGDSEAFQKHQKKILEAELATKRLGAELDSLEKQQRDIEREIEGDISASRKYYAEQRRDFLRAQIAAQKARITSAQEALTRLYAEQPSR